MPDYRIDIVPDHNPDDLVRVEYLDDVDQAQATATALELLTEQGDQHYANLYTDGPDAREVYVTTLSAAPAR